MAGSFLSLPAHFGSRSRDSAEVPASAGPDGPGPEWNRFGRWPGSGRAARRSPDDADVAEIGDELAVARTLSNLAHELDDDRLVQGRHPDACPGPLPPRAGS
ncbi:DUF1876 domain-containing protein [Kribbella sp. NBC_00889]|nr:DUF1876 domain-containing protein [Kribbella sp. NBC_00889]